jgi:outer membrane protein assembly factor BamD (BamD/ComL family)
MLADLYENKLSQPTKALELYQKIITDFPGSLYVIEARKRFRLLRGDKLG